MINRPAKNIASITGRFLVALVLLIVISLSYLAQTQAADYPKLNNRSLSLGDTSPGVATDYTLSWQYPAPTTIGSIRLEVCTDGFIDNPCVNPSADLSAATLINQTGITGFSILSQSSDEIILTRAPAAAGTGQSTYVFDSVINPASLQARFYIRISTYPTANASGPFNHFSSVGSATAEPIVINTEVPPILYFCAALTIDTWCDNVNGNHIDYGDLSAVTGDAAISQFGVATNAVGGYVVTVNGDTMTAGNRSIAPLAVPTANTPGVPQFGMNLRANTDPPNGLDVSGVGIGTVATDYNTPDVYQYNDGDIVASAVTGTLFNIFTVTYIVNVPPDQPAGVYNTTLAYICTAAF